MAKWDAQRELRFGVVLYGGVSLTIYINGVTQELLRLVRATAPGALGETLLGDGELSAVEKIYRRLASSADGTVRTRFVVDVIAGTSAGGINGVFLGKALALNQSLKGIRDLWVEKGNIDTLLNDGQSLKGLRKYQLQKPVQSLLNSQAMYAHLLHALAEMDVATPAARSPLVEDLDVYVTATDLEGLIVPLQLADRRVFERRHKTVFHFEYNGTVATSDFTAKNTPKLAFAARCTSSFPVAFEPMAQTDTDAVLKIEGVQPDQTGWDHLFADYTKQMAGTPGIVQNAYKDRVFADGGYLDNKPFSFVIDKMADRFSELPVERKLIYIEPDPDDPTLEGMRTRKPDAVENAWLGLSTLPRYEAIRGDLERVLARNAQVRRLSDILNFLRQAIAGQPTRKNLQVGEWVEMDSRDLATRFGNAYLGYHRLKVSSAKDMLANGLCEYLGLAPASADERNVVSLVSEWRNQAYGPWETPRETKYDQLNLFLSKFSVDYRVRQMRHLMSRLDEMLPPDGDERLRKIRRRAGGLFRKLAALKPEAADFAPLGADTSKLYARMAECFEGSATPGMRNQAMVAERSQDAQKQRASAMLQYYDKQIGAAADRIAVRFGVVFQESWDEATGMLAGEETADLLREFKQFEDYDAVIFPAVHNTELRELSEIGVIRVSPLDAVGPMDAAGRPVVDEQAAKKAGMEAFDKGSPRKLKGAGLGAFGGFLDEEWRRNDLMWGRLDGAERILTALVYDEALRKSMIAEAHEAILMEELGENSKLREKQTGVEKLKLYRDMLMAAPDREESANRVGRAMEILSKMTGQDLSKPGGMLGVAGKVVVGVAALASQRTLVGSFTQHWMRLLYAIELLLIVAGTFLYREAAQTGWMLLGLTVAAHLGLGAMRDFFMGSGILTTLVKAVLVMAVGGLALLGVFPAVALWEDLPSHSESLSYLLWVPVVGGLVAMVAMLRLKSPMLAMEEAATVADVERIAGDLGDNRRQAMRKAIDWDGMFLFSYGAIFVGIATVGWMSRGAHWLLWAVAGFGVLAAIADLTENVRMDNLLAMTLRELGKEIPKDWQPKGASIVKWIAFFLAILALGRWLQLTGQEYVAWVAYAAGGVGFASLLVKPMKGLSMLAAIVAVVWTIVLLMP